HGECHHEHFAGIVAASTHFHQVGVGTEITRAHLRVRLKTAGAKNDRTAAQFVFFVRIGNHDSFDSSVVAEQLPHARLVANLDSPPGRNLAPLAELSQAAADAAHRMDHETGFEVVAAIDKSGAVDLPFFSPR